MCSLSKIILYVGVGSCNFPNSSKNIIVTYMLNVVAVEVFEF